VIGMGRIAECLCPLLRAFGARVTVYARRDEALARARAMGVGTVCFSGALPEEAAAHEIICNTVPHVLYGRALLERASCDTVLLELASAPGGFDMDVVNALELTYVNGQGLPGKYAPRAAGKLIADFVIDALRREEHE
jgi:dipicolinate synthase subunit A